MPYKSEAQRRFMHAQHPGIAKQWDKKYGGKVQSGIAVGEKNPSGESSPIDFKKAAMRRLGQKPGQQSQGPKRRQMSQQVANVVRQNEAKKAVAEARKSNLSEKQYYAKQSAARRATALKRRSERK